MKPKIKLRSTDLLSFAFFRKPRLLFRKTHFPQISQNFLFKSCLLQYIREHIDLKAWVKVQTFKSPEFSHFLKLSAQGIRAGEVLPLTFF
jgi:hypothetical protein